MRALAVTVVALFAGCAGGDDAPAEGPLLAMEDIAFVPTVLDVAPGATVTVENRDDVPHTATSAAFDTGDVAPGARAAFTAPSDGEHRIACAYHLEMHATLRVRQV